LTVIYLRRLARLKILLDKIKEKFKKEKEDLKLKDDKKQEEKELKKLPKCSH